MTRGPARNRSSVLDQFGLSCARVEKASLDERLNAARQVRDEIYKNALEALKNVLRTCSRKGDFACPRSFVRGT